MTDICFDLVGFDLDGTLLDTGADLAAAVNHALGLIDRPPLPIATIKPFIGRGAKLMLEKALAVSGGVTPELLEDLHPKLLDYYADHLCIETAPYPGLIDALDTLEARGIRLAVCTNKREAFARPLLDALGLTRRFSAIVGGDTLGPGFMKPKPDLVLEMIRQAGGGRTIFLGDTENDTNAARAAGVPSIAVSFGFVACTAEELGADAGIDHYDELVPLLEHWPA